MSIALNLGACLGIAISLLFILVHVINKESISLYKLSSYPLISILKPLCGLDDNIEDILESYTKLDYPNFEILLGVQNINDTVHLIANKIANKYPYLVKLVLQEKEYGYNPKINQLISLSNTAKGTIFVISDSNIKVSKNYLQEIAFLLSNKNVGLITNPIIGTSGYKIGAQLDNLHLNSFVNPAVTTLKKLLNKNITIGKSMALNRHDLDLLGGFQIVKDILAEDYMLGLYIQNFLKKEIVLATTPIYNIVVNKSIKDFHKRYSRWFVMHRQTIGLFGYFSELIFNPIGLTILAFICKISFLNLYIMLFIICIKILIDISNSYCVNKKSIKLHIPLLVILKDFLLIYIWIYGLFHNKVNWRGKFFKVHRGTWLSKY